MPEVIFRRPTVRDAKGVHHLVAKTKELDLNSWYYYAVFFSDFSRSSIIAEVDGQIAGFVTGYMKPKRPDTLFLWQTATSLDHGVPNLGLRILQSLYSQVLEFSEIKYIEATIDPTNRAISMQFRLFARALSSEKTDGQLFRAQDFPGLTHDEQIVRIGPIGVK